MADEKTEVTMIQDDKGVTKKVRIGGVEIPVLTCSPQPAAGRMDFFMTIRDVDVKFAAEGEDPAAKDG